MALTRPPDADCPLCQVVWGDDIIDAIRAAAFELSARGGYVCNDCLESTCRQFGPWRHHHDEG